MRALKLAGVIFLATLGVGKPATPSPPQQTNAPAMAQQGESIYITVETKKGMPVRDLKPSDITITEDKVPAKIGNINCAKPDPVLLEVLLDVSASRRRDPLLLSHYRALHAFVNQVLTGDDATYLVDFSDTLFSLGAVTRDRAAISAAFDQLRLDQPRSSTSMYDAINTTAYTKFPGRSHRILIVVGDWNDNSSHLGLEAAVDAAQRNSTAIYPIVDATDDPSHKKTDYKRALSAAKRVAEETGGLFYDVRGEQEFATALQAIQAALGVSCRVDYSVPNAASTGNGVGHHLDVHSKEISISYPRVRFSTAP